MPTMNMTIAHLSIERAKLIENIYKQYLTTHSRLLIAQDVKFAV